MAELDLRYCPKTFLIEFIETYRNLPCLWNTKCLDYKDRKKRDTAFNLLLDKLKQLVPNADKSTVKAKIASIRTSFRREYNKIEESKRSGATDVYETNLWYFDLLLFTKQEEMPKASINSFKVKENEESDQDDEFDTLSSPASRCSSPSSTITNQNIINKPILSWSPSPCSPSSSSVGIKKGAKRKLKSPIDEHLDEIGDESSVNTGNYNQEDASSIFGKHIAGKLRILPRFTRLFTEKLINNLLFEAEMGNINKNSMIVTSRT